jgi:hypothetical protein
MKWVLQEGSLVRVIAQPNKGKSFMVLDWAAHLALGWDWHGHKVAKRRSVLYVAAEGLPVRRMEAWEQHHEKDIPDRLVVRDGMNISDPADVELLMEDIEEHSADVLIIDTQQRAGFQEGADMAGDSINELDRLRAEFPHLTVILVHHPGKDTSRGGRGFSGYFGALDYEFQIDADDPHELLTLTRTKQRDDGFFVPLALRLEKVILGHDEDGDEISSCVLVEADVLPEAPDAEKIIKSLVMAAAGGREVAKSEIAKLAGIRGADAQAALELLVAEGQVAITKAHAGRGRPREVVTLVTA